MAPASPRADVGAGVAFTARGGRHADARAGGRRGAADPDGGDRHRALPVPPVPRLPRLDGHRGIAPNAVERRRCVRAGCQQHGGALRDSGGRHRRRGVPLLGRLRLDDRLPGHPRRLDAERRPDVLVLDDGGRQHLHVLRGVRGRHGAGDREEERELHVRRPLRRLGEPLLLLFRGARRLVDVRRVPGGEPDREDARPLRRVRHRAELVGVVHPVGDLRVAAPVGQSLVPRLGRGSRPLGRRGLHVQLDGPLRRSEPRPDQRLQLHDQLAGLEHDVRRRPRHVRRVEPDQRRGHERVRDGHLGVRPRRAQRRDAPGPVEHHRGNGLRGRELRRRSRPGPGRGRRRGPRLHGPPAERDGRAVQRYRRVRPFDHDRRQRSLRIRRDGGRELHGPGRERHGPLVPSRCRGRTVASADLSHRRDERRRRRGHERRRRRDAVDPGLGRQHDLRQPRELLRAFEGSRHRDWASP